MISNPSPAESSVTGAGPPLLEERLDLNLTEAGIHSLRKTPGGPSEIVELAVPPEKAMDDYLLALSKTARLRDPPDDATARRIHELVVPMQQALLAAVPQAARDRIATEGSGQTRKLVAIELSLLSPQLEKYPWELLSEPAALWGDATSVIVWRRVQPRRDAPKRERWSSNLLLAGTATMLRATPYVRDELVWIKDELKGYRELHVFDYPDIQPNFQPLLYNHRPVAFHLVAHSTSKYISGGVRSNGSRTTDRPRVHCFRSSRIRSLDSNVQLLQFSYSFIRGKATACPRNSKDIWCGDDRNGRTCPPLCRRFVRNQILSVPRKWLFDRAGVPRGRLPRPGRQDLLSNVEHSGDVRFFF